MTENMAAGGELAGLRVMVIDDSKTIRRTAETLLKREGCEVVTATDGFEALAKIADQQPQIIFVDIMMPRLDGYQTCALIKGNQLFKSTPVIMLSSKDGLFDKARGRIVGSEQYLTKPFTREELLGAIRTYVNAWPGGKGTMARIVLIEDSPTDRAVFTQWLEKAGHEVLVADNAEDGVKLVRECAPQLVLMDVVLPGISGFQATRGLKRDEATKDIPVIIVSTKAMDTDRAWGLRQGASDYMVKPPREEELIARINELVS